MTCVEMNQSIGKAIKGGSCRWQWYQLCLKQASWQQSHL